MFEHSLYEPEKMAAPTVTGDLFDKYEIKSWEFSPRIYRILAISGLANVIALLVVAQTSLLTMKGCDSPLVGNVCQALDMIELGTAFMNSERDYVNVAYGPTHIDDDADVTFVDVTGVTPPLDYPEGYFQLANPDQFQTAMADANGNPLTSIDDLATIPSTPPITGGGSLLDTTPNFPKPNPNVIDGPLPSFGNSTATPRSPAGTRNNKPSKGKPGMPDEDDTAIAANTDPKANKTPEPAPSPMSTEEVNAVEINKLPLTTFADDVAGKWTAKEIDLNQNFTLVLNGVITKDGKLDLEKSKFDTAKTVGDPKMIDVGKAALEAIGASGYLTYLKTAGIDQVSAVLTQDDKEIKVVITSIQKTPERAKSISSLMSGVILLGKVKVENPSDERTLLDGAKVASEGKNFVLNFSLDKVKAQEMIQRKLKEAQAKKASPQPNGNAATHTTVNTGQ